MNIIIPREENVDSIIIDLRDVVNGMELQDDSRVKKGVDISEPAEYTAFLFYIPRHLFVNEGQNADYDTIVKNIQERNVPKVEEYVQNIDSLKELMIANENNIPLFEHTQNLQDFFDLYGYKIIELPKNKTIIVGAPLWKNSVQLISVKTTSPFKEQGDYYGKVNEVEGLGICDLDFVRQIKEYIDGYGVEEMEREFKQFSRQSKREKIRLQEGGDYER